MKKLLLIPVALLTSTSVAAPLISAQSIIVNPTKPALSVQVSLDKPSTTQNIATYRIGDSIRISAKVNQDAYVYLFNIDAAGKVNQILPNNIGSQHFIRAGQTVTFPAPTDQFTYDIGGPVGLNKVLALASLKELDLNTLSRFQNEQAQFATVNTAGQDRLAQALSIVVNPIPQNSWVTDTALFNVAAQAPARTGNLFVGTNVIGSTVTLNGRNLGGANQTFLNIAPGNYPLLVRASGYADYRTTITIRPNTTTNVNVQFGVPVTAPAPVRPAPVRPAPTPASYTLTIRSSVDGARVFIDGSEVGTIRGGILNTRVGAGGREVVVIAPGYKTYMNNVSISRNAEIRITPTR